jgi:hypothetical protein
VTDPNPNGHPFGSSTDESVSATIDSPASTAGSASAAPNEPTPPSGGSKKTQRWTLVATAVGVVACVGIAIALIAGSGGGGSHTSAKAGKPAQGPQGGQGVITVESLRALLGDKVAQSKVRNAPKAASSAAPDAATNAALRRCVDTLGKSQPIAFTATGVYQGHKVAIVALRQKSRTTALVMALDNCNQILASVSH